VISDVSNDDLSTIGSGLFYYDSTTFVAAEEILKRYKIWEAVQKDIRMRIEAGIRSEIPETPKPGSISIPHTIVASNSIAREAAKRKATESGYDAEVISPPLVQSVENAVQYLKEKIKELMPRSVLIFGGEITVQVRGNGIGGRNQHFALLMTKELADRNIVFLSAGTDGIDGNSNAAGAWTDGNTMKKASNMNLSIEQSIADFNSFEFFKTLNQSIITGPTGTNVMDIYLLLRE
jgi:hydroxypyruvate reductase/glycerate 2-kinase